MTSSRFKNALDSILRVRTVNLVLLTVVCYVVTISHEAKFDNGEKEGICTTTLLGMQQATAKVFYKNKEIKSEM